MAPRRSSAQQYARRQVAFRQPHRLAQNLGSFSQWQACAPQPGVRRGLKRPPDAGFIVQGQLISGDLLRPGIQAIARAHLTRSWMKSWSHLQFAGTPGCSRGCWRTPTSYIPTTPQHNQAPRTTHPT